MSLKPIQNLKPFHRFCMTIGVLPTAFNESMSYFECLQWLSNYLENTVIPSVNNNAEALTELQNLFLELQNYVNNYFENLDVQEEINNKLDEMVINGQLTSIIENYVNPIINSQNQNIENFINNTTSDLNYFKNSINSRISAVESGSPLVANSISQMTDTSRVYVNTINGHWYYYNGTNWEDGGIYQSSGINNKSITQLMLNDDTLNNFNMSKIIYDLSSFKKRIGTTLNKTDRDYACVFFPQIWFPAGTIINFIGDTDIFKFSIVNLAENYDNDDDIEGNMTLLDSGWQENTDYYITQKDGYLSICLAYRATSLNIDNTILNNLSNYFMIKIPTEIYENYIQYLESFKYAKNIDLTKHSIGRVGTKADTFRTYSYVLLLTNKMKAGTKIKFNQNNSNYRWTIVESETLSKDSNTIKDFGWKTKNGEIIVDSDCYVWLTFGSSSNDIPLTDNDIQKLYSFFEVCPVNDVNLLEEKIINNSLFENVNINAINHRGFNTLAPENTLSAFKLSKKMGFKYVECDVQFTSDNIPVLLHDDTINRTSNGSGNIAELTFDYVRTLDFGSWFSSYYSNEKIPSFEEFISLCKNIGLHPYIEIKATDITFTSSQLQLLVDIVKKYAMLDKVTWISYNHNYLATILTLCDYARVGYIRDTITDNAINNVINYLHSQSNKKAFIDTEYNNLTNEKVNSCIQNNIPIEIWTVNDENVITDVNSYVSGFTSDNLQADKILIKSVLT